MAAAKNRVVMPWEYNVCEICLRKNSYAIWLVKCGCFDTQAHEKLNKTISVVVDVKNVKLVKVREVPKVLKTLSLCRSSGDCSKGNRCLKAHTKMEYDCWKWIHWLRTSKLIRYC